MHQMAEECRYAPQWVDYRSDGVLIRSGSLLPVRRMSLASCSAIGCGPLSTSLPALQLLQSPDQVSSIQLHRSGQLGQTFLWRVCSCLPWILEHSTMAMLSRVKALLAVSGTKQLQCSRVTTGGSSNALVICGTASSLTISPGSQNRPHDRKEYRYAEGALYHCPCCVRFVAGSVPLKQRLKRQPKPAVCSRS